MRYSHIACDFCDAYMLEWMDDPDKGTARFPPLLPSLLAACAPSTELSLSVYSNQYNTRGKLVLVWQCNSSSSCDGWHMNCGLRGTASFLSTEEASLLRQCDLQERSFSS